MLQIGKYKHRMQIQVPVQTQDQTTGAIDTGWSTIAEVWCKIEPINVRSTELNLGDQIIGEMYSYVCMRFSQVSSQITAAHRGVHQGVVYNFVNVAHQKLEQREIKILATSGVNSG